MFARLASSTRVHRLQPGKWSNGSKDATDIDSLLDSLLERQCRKFLLETMPIMRLILMLIAWYRPILVAPVWDDVQYILFKYLNGLTLQWNRVLAFRANSFGKAQKNDLSSSILTSFHTRSFPSNFICLRMVQTIVWTFDSSQRLTYRAKAKHFSSHARRRSLWMHPLS